jgi:octaprenyl-diphosphate synthase
MKTNGNPTQLKSSPQTMDEVLLSYQEDIQSVENQIKDSLSSSISLINDVFFHILQSGGKRLRPLLLIIASRLFSYKGKDHIILGSVMEFIHTATLLHDDVVDEASLRRGRKAARMVWGNQASILVGDYLFSRAFIETVGLNRDDLNFLLSHTCQTLSEGEILQLINTHNFSMNEKDYLKIIEFKTASLISLSCRVGALLAGAPEKALDALSRFGLNLGIAYQIADDTLDYMAEKELLGKTLGQDFKEGKLTMPLLHLMSKCGPEERNKIEEMFHQDQFTDKELVFIQKLLGEYRSCEYALLQAESFCEKAKQQIASFLPSPHKNALNIIADYVITRNR